ETKSVTKTSPAPSGVRARQAQGSQGLDVRVRSKSPGLPSSFGFRPSDLSSPANLRASLCSQRRAQVTFTRRTGDGHNRFAFVLGTFRHLDRRPHVRSRRNTGQDALFFCQTPGHVERIIVGDLDALDNLRITLGIL